MECTECTRMYRMYGQNVQNVGTFCRTLDCTDCMVDVWYVVRTFETKCMHTFLKCMCTLTKKKKLYFLNSFSYKFITHI